MPSSSRNGLVRRIAMRPRATLVKLHRWVSLVLLAWLVVISVTGVVLVLDDHLDHWLHSELFEHGTKDLGPDRAAAAVEESMPSEAHVSNLTLPVNASGVYFVEYTRPMPGAAKPAEGEEPEEEYYRAYVDPATAHVNGVRKPYTEGFVWWMYRGHMYLWQDQGLFGVNAPGGYCESPSGWFAHAACTVIPDGDDLIAWFGLAWMVVLLTGFHLWYWPGVKRWARALRVRRGRGAFTFNLDAHKAIGLVVLVPLLVITFTGAAFAFPLMKNLYERATPAQSGYELWTPPDDGAVSAKAPKDAERITYTAAIASVHRAHPTWRIDTMAPPADETGVFSSWVDKGYSTWSAEGAGGNTLVHVDQYTGKLRYVGSPSEGNVFDQAWDDWSFPLHAGDAFSEPGRIVWVFVGLSPLVLGVSGLLMNRIRHRKRKRRAAAGPDSGRTSLPEVEEDTTEMAGV